MAICFVGVVAIALSKTSGSSQSTTPVETVDGGKPPQIVGIAVSFGTAWGLAIVACLNRYLKEVHYTVIGFWHPLVGQCLACIYIAIMLNATGHWFEIHEPVAYVLGVLGGVSDFCALTCVNLAFQNDSSGFVSIIGYMAVFYSFLADQFLFDAPITGFDLVGAICILCVTFGTAVYKLRLQQKQIKQI